MSFYSLSEPVGSYHDMELADYRSRIRSTVSQSHTGMAGAII